jgi:hypothetical protein
VERIAIVGKPCSESILQSSDKVALVDRLKRIVRNITGAPVLVRHNSRSDFASVTPPVALR